MPTEIRDLSGDEAIVEAIDSAYEECNKRQEEKEMINRLKGLAIKCIPNWAWRVLKAVLLKK